MTGEEPTAASLATEAALLLDAVADRLTGLRPDDAAAGDQGAEPARCPECGTVPGAPCTACPVCRFLAFLRGERPETAVRFVDGALLIVRGLRSLLPEPDFPGVPDAPTPPAGPPRGGFERIDIR